MTVSFPDCVVGKETKDTEKYVWCTETHSSHSLIHYLTYKDGDPVYLAEKRIHHVRNMKRGETC